MRFKLPEGRTIRVLFLACDVQKPILSRSCLAQQVYCCDLRADVGTLFFPDKIQTEHSETLLYMEENLFFVKGMLMASWCERRYRSRVTDADWPLSVGRCGGTDAIP